jgi:hypothetical protein
MTCHLYLMFVNIKSNHVHVDFPKLPVQQMLKKKFNDNWIKQVTEAALDPLKKIILKVHMQTYIIIVPFLRLGHFLINHIIWYRYWYCNTHFSHVCINWPWPNLHVRLCKYYFCWKYLLCTFKIIFFNGSSAASDKTTSNMRLRMWNIIFF